MPSTLTRKTLRISAFTDSCLLSDSAMLRSVYHKIVRAWQVDGHVVSKNAHSPFVRLVSAFFFVSFRGLAVACHPSIFVPFSLALLEGARRSREYSTPSESSASSSRMKLQGLKTECNYTITSKSFYTVKTKARTKRVQASATTSVFKKLENTCVLHRGQCALHQNRQCQDHGHARDHCSTSVPHRRTQLLASFPTVQHTIRIFVNINTRC